MAIEIRIFVNFFVLIFSDDEPEEKLLGTSFVSIPNSIYNLFRFKIHRDSLMILHARTIMIISTIQKTLWAL